MLSTLCLCDKFGRMNIRIELIDNKKGLTLIAILIVNISLNPKCSLGETIQRMQIAKHPTANNWQRMQKWYMESSVTN